MNRYLEMVHLGKTDWWRFLLSIIVMISFWQILGGLPVIVLLVWVMGDGNPQTGVSSNGQFFGVNPTLSFSVQMMASLFFILGIFVAIRFIHDRPFKSLITPTLNIDWRRIFQGFIVWFILLGTMSLLEAFLYPGRYSFSLNLHIYIPFALVALVLLPIQTTAEELFFRGYIIQSTGLRISNIFLLSSISGFIFMVPHLLNPEARLNYLLMGFYYFIIGGVMAFITLREGRLELALGLHAANNVFSALIANYTITVLPTPSVFTVNTLDVIYSVLAAVIGLIGFILVFTNPKTKQ